MFYPKYANTEGLRFNDTFLQLFCEKNSDGTKKLRLKGNELQQRFKDRLFPADMVHVCTFLKNHREINDLDLSYNYIENEGLQILCQATFQYTNSLEHLNVTHCDITEVGMKTLFFASEGGFIKLKTLKLTGNKIGPRGGHLAALLVPHVPTLEYLDLAETDQTADSINSIFLHVYRSTVKIVDVSRPIPHADTERVDNEFLSESIGELFRVNRTLVEMHAQKCEFTSFDVENLIMGLKLNTSLRFLDIGYNNICCIGMELLAEWLKTRPNLLGLNVAGNNIRNHGAVALSFAMPLTKLRYLDISSNHIGEEGMTAILTTIKKPYMLRYFLVWGNSFSQPTLKLLQKMMNSQVFEQRGIDVKIYSVDGVLQAARYFIDKWKHRYYGVVDYGCAVELKIKRNKIETSDDKPRALVNFKYIDRYPPVENVPKVNKIKQ